MQGRLWRGVGSCLSSPASPSRKRGIARVIAVDTRVTSSDTTGSCHPLLCSRLSSTASVSTATSGPVRPSPPDAFQLVAEDLSSMTRDIHSRLGERMEEQTELSDLARYYFDGQGKAVRPVIALCLGRAASLSRGGKGGEQVVEKQRQVAVVSEMIHTASLLHDDVLDHAQIRRGKPSINARWDARRSTLAGDYVLAVGAHLLAGIENTEVTCILSQVLADLVQGEFQQLETKEDEGQERFEHYLTKSFNKTASLMAYSCQATALLAGLEGDLVKDAFTYGRNIGVAFQLVDDLLDFIASADQLGKPAATDLSLGLATAPVLFAAEKFPQLNLLIARRFERLGDVEEAFRLVQESGGLEETRGLARKHCSLAVKALGGFEESDYKEALEGLCDRVLNRLK